MPAWRPWASDCTSTQEWQNFYVEAMQNMSETSVVTEPIGDVVHELGGQPQETIKKEEEMPAKKGFVVGDRVIVYGQYNNIYFKGFKGTVVKEKTRDRYMVVKFDRYNSLFHDGGGRTAWDRGTPIGEQGYYYDLPENEITVVKLSERERKGYGKFVKEKGL